MQVGPPHTPPEVPHAVQPPGSTSSAPVTAATTTTGSPCATCGSSPCLALIRADTPPVGFIDFLDRALARISSDHWTIRQSGHLIAITTVIMLAAALAGLAVTDRLTPLAGYAVHAPWGWAYLAGGGGVLAGGGYAVRRIHRRSKPIG
jgi:hypothetical protein